MRKETRNPKKDARASRVAWKYKEERTAMGVKEKKEKRLRFTPSATASHKNEPKDYERLRSMIGDA